MSALDQVLILAPYRRDAEYIRRLLSGHDIGVEVCTDAQEFAERLAALPGVLVTTHEGLTSTVLETVANHLHAQPSWSEMPIVVLLDRSAPHAEIRIELTRRWPRAHLLFYQRPLTSLELVSGVQSALVARLRQQEVRDHIAREIELRRELNHRVKNILASVISLFEIARRNASSVDEFAANFRARIEALSRVHSASFEAAVETVSIGDIASLVFEPYRLQDRQRIVTEGPEVTVPWETGTTLALCLHELATNAIKYGALSSIEGRVHLTWDVSTGDEPELSMVWQETGGPAVAEPSRTGYGTRYLRTALAGVFGRPPLIAFEASGLRCEARGDLARVASKS